MEQVLVYKKGLFAYGYKMIWVLNMSSSWTNDFTILIRLLIFYPQDVLQRNSLMKVATQTKKLELILDTQLTLLHGCLGNFGRHFQHQFLAFKSFFFKLIGSWGRRSMAVAGEVTRHGRAHPYSWSITIVSLRSKKSEE